MWASDCLWEGFEQGYGGGGLAVPPGMHSRARPRAAQVQEESVPRGMLSGGKFPKFPKPWERQRTSYLQLF